MQRSKLKRKLIAPLIVTLAMVTGMTVQAESIRVPEDVRQISVELGTQYSICPELIQSTCFKESSFDPRAENGSHIGIMQVNPVWHADRMTRLGVTDLYDTRSCMLVGVDYLHELIQQYEDVSVALMKYNGDSRAEGLLDGSGDVSEYADEILRISAELERENGK
ncbi:MAG: lytic transglycosylase domain-containing protein [Lachnospiraceae bacterium]|nr:lytic transglycosylase domain-containing protein [Lachnospiraceae bacterium]